MQSAFQDPALAVTVAGIFGLAVGSFLNVVVHRLPRMMERDWKAQCAHLRGEEPAPEPAYNLWTPRSACPSCGRPVRASENIPVLSWLFLRGRCAGCRTPISIRYPIVELAAGILAAVMVWKFGWNGAGIAAAGFAWALIALTGIDLDTQLLPDAITLPLLWAGLLVNFSGTFVGLESAVLGAAAGYLFLWAVYWAFKLATGKEGMGYGDFKLLAAVGAWLGWKMLPVVVIFSAATGAVVGLALIALRDHGRGVPIPFGPYLAGGGLLALLAGEPIVDAYLSTL